MLSSFPGLAIPPHPFFPPPKPARTATRTTTTTTTTTHAAFPSFDSALL